MGTWQKIAIVLLELVLGFVAGFTWGSIGSIVCTLGMIMIPCVFLWQKYLSSDRNSDFFEDDNG